MNSSPKHIGVIMDGNGRWAADRGRPRLFGHIRGAQVAKRLIRACAERKIESLTLYTFSLENWSRPSDEVSFLMRLLHRHLIKEEKQLIKQNIRFEHIGDLSLLPKTVQNLIQELKHKTKFNQGMVLTFALSYGGRQEIVQAAKSLAHKTLTGQIHPDEINEHILSENMSSNFLPEVDLVIRTSGEYRLSNFMTWQTAYSELYFTKTLWPDFTIDELDHALMIYKTRQRRFGRTSEQLSDNAFSPNTSLESLSRPALLP